MQTCAPACAFQNKHACPWVPATRHETTYTHVFLHECAWEREICMQTVRVCAFAFALHWLSAMSVYWDARTRGRNGSMKVTTHRQMTKIDSKTGLCVQHIRPTLLINHLRNRSCEILNWLQ